MEQYRKISLISLLLLLPVVVYSAQTFDLKPESVSDAISRLAMVSQVYTRTGREMPEGIKGLPKDLPEHARFFSLSLTGREVFFFMDINPEKPLLYVDKAGEKDFTGVKSLKGTEKDRRIVFGNIELPFERDDENGQITISIETYNGGDYVIHRPGEVRYGKVTFSRETYDFAIIDGNYDGRYDSESKDGNYGNCDYFFVDLNGNGTLEQTGDYTELFPLAQGVLIAGGYYNLTPAPDGSKVTVEEIKLDTGYLEISSRDVTLNASSKYGPHNLNSAESRISLPAGTYTGRMIYLRKKDDAGKEWGLRAYSNVGEVRSFEVRKGEITKIKVGTPLTIKPNVSMRGDTVEIGMDLIGAGREIYTAGATVDGRMMPAPKLRVVDRDGAELIAGSFQYG